MHSPDTVTAMPHGTSLMQKSHNLQVNKRAI